MTTRVLLAFILVIAAVGGASAQATYTPPAGQSIDTLVEGYNANVEQVPGWLDAAVNADVVYLTIYPEVGDVPDDLFATESAPSVPSVYRFEMGVDGKITEFNEADTVERGGGTYVVATDRATMDAILTADDPVSVGTAAFTDGAVQLQANGTVQNVMIRVVRFASQVRELFG